MVKLTQEYVFECFTYIEDGCLIWKERPRKHFNSNMGWKVFNGMYPGKIAGRLHHKGYLEVKIAESCHVAVHRIVWLYHKGSLPKYVDHINRDKSDNRIENLREVTQQENCCNRTIRKDNAAGHTGVRGLPGGKFGVRINFKGKTHWFGTYSTLEEAVYAHKRGSRSLRGEYCPYNRQ